jgi:DNA-binding transcriptional MerR regulator
MRMSKKLVYKTTSDVAELFGVDGATVRRWVLDGRVKPDVTTPGGHHRFTDKTIDALKAESAPGGVQRSQVA